MINKYIYNGANDYLILMSELFANCDALQQEPYDPRIPLEY